MSAQITHIDPEETIRKLKSRVARLEKALAAQPGVQEPVDSVQAIGNLMFALTTWKATTSKTAPAAWKKLLQACAEMVATEQAAQPAVPLTDDTRRLDALAKNSWDLRCFDMSDEDIGWRVIERHMAKPHERTVAEVFRDDPRQAIDAAIEAAHGIAAATEKGN